MYHKLNIEKSFWKPYLNSIENPSTLVNWKNNELYGINKSAIE